MDNEDNGIAERGEGKGGVRKACISDMGMSPL